VYRDPFPFDGTEVTCRQRVNRCFGPRAAAETYRSHPGDLNLFRYLILPLADPPRNHRPFALFTWIGHEMKIMAGASFGLRHGSSPRTWHNGATGSNRNFIDW